MYLVDNILDSNALDDCSPDIVYLDGRSAQDKLEPVEFQLEELQTLRYGVRRYLKIIPEWASVPQRVPNLTLPNEAQKSRSGVERYLNLALRKEVQKSRFDVERYLNLSLQKEVQKSKSDVERYLNLGLIGVCEMLAERDLGMDNLMDLWQKFHSFLLLLQHLYLKLEKILALWEKVLYLLLLYLSFSEFPNRLRPPCTTMPWTIWPVLVVLWGVCWMFYDEDIWNWVDHGEPLTADSMTGLFEDIGHTDPSQVFHSDIDDISYNMSVWNTPHFDVPNLEQQLQLCVPDPATTSDTATSLDSIPTSSAVDPADTFSLPVTNHGNTSGIAATPSFSSCPAASTIQRVTEDRQLEATESRALVPLTSLVHRKPRDGQIGPSRSSKHSQTEKYFCSYSDCVHSEPGSGFKRKDHLDQHLRGLHKQTSVQRLRAKPAAPSSIGNPTATNDTAEAPLQSKKRKRGSEEDTSGSNLDRLERELAEERKLRRLAEEDNYSLRQKLENYERRMEKYEERLDRMVTLLEENKGEERRQ